MHNTLTLFLFSKDSIFIEYEASRTRKITSWLGEHASFIAIEVILQAEPGFREWQPSYNGYYFSSTLGMSFIISFTTFVLWNSGKWVSNGYWKYIQLDRRNVHPAGNVISCPTSVIYSMSEFKSRKSQRFDSFFFKLKCCMVILTLNVPSLHEKI